MCCQFQVVPVGKGLIALQGHNGLHVSRVQHGGVSSIEVMKESPDEECKFVPKTGTGIQ